MDSDNGDSKSNNNQKEREILINLENQCAVSFDKYLTTLSAGGLVLFVTFIGQLEQSPTCLRAAYVAIGALGSALIASLASLLTGQYSLRREQVILSSSNTKNCWTIWTMVLNVSSLALFILGVCSLLIFSCHNLP